MENIDEKLLLKCWCFLSWMMNPILIFVAVFSAIFELDLVELSLSSTDVTACI